MKTLNIAFLDGGHFCQNMIFDLLSDKYEIKFNVINPDLLVYSLYGNDHKKFNCKKLQIIGENSFPNFNECDYAISPHYITFERHCRIPFFVFNKEYKLLCNKSKINVIDQLNRKFCSAVISNNLNADPRREEILKKLNERKHIDSVGKVLNTTGKYLPARVPFAENTSDILTNPVKIAFMSQYKFNLALENSQVEGYCTEKITDAFIANTIPIYFGDTKIKNEFNNNSFINISNFKSIDDAIDYILEIDKNNDMYLNMLNSPNIICNTYLTQFKDFLIKVIEGPIFEHKYGNFANQNH